MKRTPKRTPSLQQQLRHAGDSSSPIPTGNDSLQLFLVTFTEDSPTNGVAVNSLVELPRAAMHPADMADRGLLPDDFILVQLDSGPTTLPSPFWLGPVWPLRRAAERGRVHLPITATAVDGFPAPVRATVSSSPSPPPPLAPVLTVRFDAASAAVQAGLGSEPIPQLLTLRNVATRLHGVLLQPGIDRRCRVGTVGLVVRAVQTQRSHDIFHTPAMKTGADVAAIAAVTSDEYSIVQGMSDCSIAGTSEGIGVATPMHQRAFLQASSPAVLDSGKLTTRSSITTADVVRVDASITRVSGVASSHDADGFEIFTKPLTAASQQPSVPIGGLGPQLSLLLEMASSALRLSPAVSDVFAACGIRPPTGALLSGPPGTGKTLLARALAERTGSRLLVINGPEVLRGRVGESEARLRSIFDYACSISRDDDKPAAHTYRGRRETGGGGGGEGTTRSGGCIIFIDEVDGLCPRRDTGGGEVEARVVATLAALLDALRPPTTFVEDMQEDVQEDEVERQLAEDNSGVESLQLLQSALTPSLKKALHRTSSQRNANVDARVFVLAATNRATAVDAALRRPGRFDREVHIGVPNAVERVEILGALLVSYPHTCTPDDIKMISSRCHGYVGADLAALCAEGARAALRRLTKDRRTDDADTSRAAMMCPADLAAALRAVQPSALREVTVEVPDVSWNDIGGQADAKARLREAVEWPLTHPEAFVALGMRPPKGVLLYGPPGSSEALTSPYLGSWWNCPCMFIHRAIRHLTQVVARL